MKNTTTTATTTTTTTTIPFTPIVTTAVGSSLARGVRQSRFDRDRQFATEANAFAMPKPVAHSFVPHIESPSSLHPSQSPNLSPQPSSTVSTTTTTTTPSTTPTPTPTPATTGTATAANSNPTVTTNLSNNHGVFWGEYRHSSCGSLNPKLHEEPRDVLDRWGSNTSNNNNSSNSNSSEHKARTVYGVIMACLNLGVDPPDARKPEKCATVEAWVDPGKYSSPNGVPDMVIKELGDQYAQLRGKVSYAKCIDPTIDNVRNSLLSARRAAGAERVLVHYNGHGVPAPSKNGEIWAFSVDYKQYVPIPFTDIHSFVTLPAMWVFECSRAGLAVDHYAAVYEHVRRERDLQMDQSMNVGGGVGVSGIRRRQASNPGQRAVSQQQQKKSIGGNSGGGALLDELILLGACRGNELLPFNPDYPADVFTACLTTPIRIAVLWFCKHSALRKYPGDIFQRITGDPDKRNTPLGELAWIFTTVTEAIAYDILPLRTFQRLFRQDLMVTTLFRNFLLAERVMRSLGCHPVSYPRIPKSYKHPLWESWDLALDTFLSQIMASTTPSQPSPSSPSSSQQQQQQSAVSVATPTAPRSYVHTSFLAQQLNGFDSWLSFSRDFRHAPAQLVVVRQAIPSQFHRVTALRLLGRFMDMGPQAVEQTVTVTTVAYFMRYFTNCTAEIRGEIAHIWARIIAYDRRYQLDIIKEHGERFFMAMLTEPEVSEQARVTAAFVLAVLMAGCPEGQQACSDNHFISRTISMFGDQNKKYFASERFTQWVLLCFAKIWENNDSVRYKAAMCHIAKVAIPCLESRSVEVRAAAVHAIATFFNPAFRHVYHASVIEILKECDFAFLVSTAPAVSDPSPLVRREAVFALSRFVAPNLLEFANVVQRLLVHNPKEPFDSASKAVNAHAYAWRSLTLLAADPQQSVAEPARRVTAAVQQFVRMALPPLTQQQQQQQQVGAQADPAEYAKEVLPEILVGSTFFDWACEAWILPGTQGSRRKATGEVCGEEDTSAPAFKDREKKYRNFSVMCSEAREAWSAWNHAAKKDSFYQLCSLSTPKDEYSTILMFHPYENTFVCATSKETIK